MRAIQVDERSFDVPRYVRRVQGGWQVYLPTVPTKFFGDTTHKSVALAHAAACAYRFSLLPWQPEDRGAYYRHVENEDKLNPLGIPGVFLVHRPNGTAVLHVKVKGMPTFLITLGSVGSYENKLPLALDQARAARDRLIKEKELIQSQGGAA